MGHTLIFLNHCEYKHMGILMEERVNVFETAGENCCVAACGQKVYDIITAALCENKKIELSFAEVSELTPAFLNSAIGQLYGYKLEAGTGHRFHVNRPKFKAGF
jgi:hypothetical protein